MSRVDGGRHRRRSRLALLVMLALGGGCASPTGEAEVELIAMGRSRAELRSDFDVAAFSQGPAATAIYLSDVPLAGLVDGSATTAQVVHIELFWKPRAGFTPIEDEATNASIRYVMFVDGEVGIYGGAGLVNVRGRLDRERVRFRVAGASMSLLDATPGFVDRLSPAGFNADVIAVRNEEQTLRVRQAVSQRVTDAFGETRIVLHGAARPEGAPVRRATTLVAWVSPDGVQPTMAPILTLR